MKIDHVKGHKISRHRLVIDFQYQSISWHRLLSIDIDYRFYRLVALGIAHLLDRLPVAPMGQGLKSVPPPAVADHDIPSNLSSRHSGVAGQNI